MTNQLSHSVAACLAGAGLAIFGATRVWSVEVTTRPGLSDLREPATGADAQPWLVALSLIALAGAGALVATRGVVRRGLGVVIMLVGAGMMIAAIAGRTSVDAGTAGAGATLWPAACVAGGALVALAGLSAARHGQTWPVMGARYERTHPTAGPGERAGPGRSLSPGTADGDQVEGVAGDTRAVWDALDRGEDPTAR
ncbi:MAG TPA: Trp biosynthesis-associated membrane protein [Actinoplanes sp.]|nr:Trp biosynthesis-associated membrane protein [Actinoplanes sp.]